MVSSGYDIVTGQGLTQLLATILNQAANNQNALYQTAGYYDPYSVGFQSMAPTLDRELGMGQLGLGFAGLGLDRSLGMGNLQLGQDSLNYQQRRGEKDVLLDAYGLLSSQRGPENYLSYNYLLNAMGTPEGTPAALQEFVKGLVQPSNAVGTAERFQDQAPAAPQMRVQANEPRDIERPRKTGNLLQQTDRTPKGQKVGTSYTTLDDGSALVVDQNRLDTDPGYLDLIRRSVESGKRLPGLAQGGQTSAPLVQVGDSPSGAPTGNEELLVNPTGAPMSVVPNEAIPPGMDGQPAGPPSAEEILQIIAQLIQSMSQGQQQGQPQQGVVAAADGFTTPGTVYQPDDIASAPAVQQFLGNMSSPRFGTTMLDTTLPGTNTDLGSMFNVRNFNRLSPTEQLFISGLYETPREQGGLGVDFRDIYSRSLAAAPTGRSFGITGYGV